MRAAVSAIVRYSSDDERGGSFVVMDDCRGTETIAVEESPEQIDLLITEQVCEDEADFDRLCRAIAGAGNVA